MRFLFVFFVFLTVALCAAHSPLAHCQPYRLIIPCRWPPGIAKESSPPRRDRRASASTSSTGCAHGETQNAPPTQANRAPPWSLFHPHSQRRHSACGPDVCALFFLRYLKFAAREHACRSGCLSERWPDSCCRSCAHSIQCMERRIS